MAFTNLLMTKKLEQLDNEALSENDLHIKNVSFQNLIDIYNEVNNLKDGASITS
jgi:hypothetical protein